VTVGDLDGDGTPDLVVSNACRSADDCSSGSVGVLLGRRDGTFHGASRNDSGGNLANSVVAGEFNGDSKIDIVVANGDGTCVLLGNGDGSVQAPIPYYPGGVSIAAGYLNQDGQPDVVVSGGLVSTVTVLLNVAAGYRQSTTTTLTSSPNPSAVDQSVLFTATVTSQYGGTPTGTVTFKSGTDTLGQSALDNGQATLNYAFTSAGVDRITADYSGDENFNPSSSQELKQKVVRALTTTTLDSSPNPSQVGQTVTFTATVSGQYGGTPTGTVSLKDRGKVLATVPLKHGVAIYKTSGLGKGKHHVFARYSGDANFRPSSGSVVQVVE